MERPPSGTRSMGVVMFNVPVFDVAIGMFLLFFVASLLASAVVEAIGGFLHRRQKHLWDSLDLLLGNTSIADDVAVRRIVNDVYQQPFITGLVRPLIAQRSNRSTTMSARRTMRLWPPRKPRSCPSK